MGTLGDITQTYLDRLRAVSMPTRMLALSVVVILAMGLYLVSLYAARPELVPLPVTLKGEARGRAIDYLASRGMTFEDTGSVILVQQGARDKIITELNEASVITPDQIDFDKLVKDERMFLTKGQQRTRSRVATQNVLARMISQMTNIKSATVVISGGEDYIGIGRAFVPRTASVNVITQSAALSPASVDAIARMVAGSVSGLKAESVSIIDARTGRAIAARSDEAMASTRNIEIKLAAERMAQKRLEEALGYIGGIRISVNAVVETREIVQETTSFEDPKQGVTEEMMSESSHASPPRGGEPGIRANTGLRVTTAIQSMAAGPTSSDSTERVASVPAFGRSDQRVTDPGGYALEINASVGIPRSYYVALYRMRTGSDPNDPVAGEAFEELVRSSLESIEAQVQPLIATGSMEGSRQGEVTVSIFEDISSPSAPNEARGAAMTAGFNSTGGPAGPNSWVTDAGLGLLVLLAMGMMVLMLRRVGRLKTIGPEVLDRPLLPEDVEVLGDVDDTDVVLDGVEIDQEEVRRRVMLDQIRDAVEAHPEESASVLRRWTRADS